MIVYVPVEGSVVPSISPVPEATATGATRREPLGVLIDTFTVQHAVGANAIRRLMRSPAVPANVTRPF
jgi:hypothetical protein